MDAANDLSSCIDPALARRARALDVGGAAADGRARARARARAARSTARSQPEMERLARRAACPPHHLDTRAPHERVRSWLRHAQELEAVRVVGVSGGPRVAAALLAASPRSAPARPPPRRRAPCPRPPALDLGAAAAARAHARRGRRRAPSSASRATPGAPSATRASSTTSRGRSSSASRWRRSPSPTPTTARAPSRTCALHAAYVTDYSGHRLRRGRAAAPLRAPATA